MIQLSDVGKTFRRGTREVKALDGVTLHLEKGEYVVVEGPSGSGKTTLLFVMAGLIRPTVGEVVVDDVSLGACTPAKLAKLRKKCFGFVFQMFHLIPYLSAQENVMVPMGLAGASPDEATRRAGELLERFGLAERSGHLPAELSAGEKQRVAIARAVANHPPVILADEPTGNLDRRAADEVFDAFDDIQRDGTAVVVVTHDERVAAKAQRVIRLDGGRLCETAEPPRPT